MIMGVSGVVIMGKKLALIALAGKSGERQIFFFSAGGTRPEHGWGGG
jgi:hypothetical protein